MSVERGKARSKKTKGRENRKKPITRPQEPLNEVKKKQQEEQTEHRRASTPWRAGETKVLLEKKRKKKKKGTSKEKRGKKEEEQGRKANKSRGGRTGCGANLGKVQIKKRSRSQYKSKKSKFAWPITGPWTEKGDRGKEKKKPLTDCNGKHDVGTVGKVSSTDRSWGKLKKLLEKRGKKEMWREK